jgi:hypothetical protein
MRSCGEGNFWFRNNLPCSRGAAEAAWLAAQSQSIKMDGEEVPGSLQEEYHEEPAIVVNPPFLHEIGSSGVDHDCSPKKKKGYTLSGLQLSINR